MPFRPAIALPAALLSASLASAQVVEIPFDVANSTLDVTLSIAGSSDDDSSPVTGSVTIDVEEFGNPIQFRVLDLNLAATESIDHNISFSILGSFTQSTTGVMVNYATPGTPSAVAPIAGTSFTIPTLEVIPSGISTYNATGIVCSLLMDQMLPCSGTAPLAGTGAIAGENITGSIVFSGGMVTFDLSLTLEVPFDETNPDAGSLEMSLDVTGSAELPAEDCPGDCDGSGAVDFNDLVSMLFEFGSAEVASCDADDSGTVDFNDLVAALFLFGPCD